MKEMTSHITIGNLIFRNKVNSAKVNESWKNLTQTAMIKLPRFKKLLEGNESKYKIKVGDPVMIHLGYDGILNKEFEGYVSEISPRTPLEIKCEDEMWKLKQRTVKKTWGQVKLKEIITYLIPEADVKKVPDVTLSSFRLDYVTTYKALEKLKDEYGLVIYYRNKKLVAGFAYFETGLPKVIYHFQRNIPKDEIDKNLIFKNADEVKVKVKAISILKNNKRLDVEVGDAEGEQRTLHFYNIQTKDELAKQANELINNLKYSGYRGNIKMFGNPYATHGMSATFIDDRYKERQGEYFIDATETTYDITGYRREITPGRKSGASLFT